MSEPQLNPQALEAATWAVSLAEREMHTNESLGRQRHIAERAVTAYLTAARPEPDSIFITDEMARVAAALHGDNCPDDPAPGAACSCDGDTYYRMAKVALEAAAQPRTVETVEEIPADLQIISWEEGPEHESWKLSPDETFIGLSIKTDRSWSLADRYTLRIERRPTEGGGDA